MSARHYDIAVIGGGIHGVGVAQAAAAAGYTALVLEKATLASGTSSRSSKLIHGGLRYLESGEFHLVRENLAERALLLRLAPDLIHLRDFLIPVYERARRPPWLLQTGLSLYTLLGGFSRDARFRRIPRGRWAQLDGLRQQGLRAVFSYHDAQTDDRLLTRAVMRSACSLGAELREHSQLRRAVLTAQGCQLEVESVGKQYCASASVVVNAAGPWVNHVAARIRPAPQQLPVDLVQGTHILLPGPVKQGLYYVESPRDGRAVFVMPWGDYSLIGTTETRFEGDPDRVAPLPREIAYLASVAGHYFSRYRGAAASSELVAFAGLRVLPAGSGHAFHRSRATTLLPHCINNRIRLLSIYGGKLTGYRATAEKVVQRLRATLPYRRPAASTAELMLSVD